MAVLKGNARSGRLAELAAAISLLTRIGLPFEQAAPSDGVWAYPLAGLLVGMAAAGIWVVARSVGVPPLPGAVLALAASTLLTGGLHEDGFADTADALSGGWTVERRLLILRDSRIGAHGAFALALSLLLRTGALAALPPRQGAAALLASGLLSRGAILPVLLCSRPARPDGLGASLGEVRRGPVAAGAGLAVLPGFLFGGVSAVLAAALAATGGVMVARHRFGGFTGDLLGATVVAAECGVLLSASIS